MSELLAEQRNKMDAVEAFKRLKRATGVPAGVSGRRAMQWLAKRGLAKRDESRGVWLFRRLPLTDEQWIEEVLP
jgi:hypothetical protein